MKTLKKRILCALMASSLVLCNTYTSYAETSNPSMPIVTQVVTGATAIGLLLSSWGMNFVLEGVENISDWLWWKYRGNTLKKEGNEVKVTESGAIVMPSGTVEEVRQLANDLVAEKQLQNNSVATQREAYVTYNGHRAYLVTDNSGQIYNYPNDYNTHTFNGRWDYSDVWMTAEYMSAMLSGLTVGDDVSVFPNVKVSSVTDDDKGFVTYNLQETMANGTKRLFMSYTVQLPSADVKFQSVNGDVYMGVTGDGHIVPVVNRMMYNGSATSIYSNSHVVSQSIATTSDELTNTKESIVTGTLSIPSATDIPSTGGVAVSVPQVGVVTQGAYVGEAELERAMEQAIASAREESIVLNPTIEVVTDYASVVPIAGTGTPDIVVPADKEGFVFLGLENIFPFCIPFDLYNLLSIFNASPQTPRFEIPIVVPNVINYTLVIDFAPFSGVAAVLRGGLEVLFCIGLALWTRNLIRG